MEITIVDNSGVVVETFTFTDSTTLVSLIDAINSGLTKRGFVECNYCDCLCSINHTTETTRGMIACKDCFRSV